MERSELKELLKRKGVRPELIEMPAVIEPIYKEVVDKTVSQVEKGGELEVRDDGTYYCSVCKEEKFYDRDLYRRKYSDDLYNNNII